jgi:predicted HTH transcriptional regulator
LETTICAMANSYGGIILIGVAEDAYDVDLPRERVQSYLRTHRGSRGVA